MWCSLGLPPNSAKSARCGHPGIAQSLHRPWQACKFEAFAPSGDAMASRSAPEQPGAETRLPSSTHLRQIAAPMILCRAFRRQLPTQIGYCRCAPGSCYRYFHTSHSQSRPRRRQQRPQEVRVPAPRLRWQPKTPSGRAPASRIRSLPGRHRSLSCPSTYLAYMRGTAFC